MSASSPAVAEPLASTGIPGLDDILHGGLAVNRLYLLEGDPGSGKTTLALQFLLEGVAEGERCLFVALSESGDELRATAATHGWSLEGLDVFELVPSDESLSADGRYTMFHPSEVELNATTRLVLDEVERLSPTRLVFDSLSELRLLAQDSLRYRRQVLMLKQFLARRHCTVFMVDDRTGTATDMVLFSIAHGVVSLERHAPAYGSLRRRLLIPKMRGRRFREGYHDFRILQGGLEVYPRLVAAEESQTAGRGTLPSGVAALDQLMGGGLTAGTSTLIIGPAGTGKSAIATRFAFEAAERGERTAVFLFDESEATYLQRAAGLGMPMKPALEAGLLSLRRIDPAELTPGELAHDMRDAVERDGVRVVVVDSLNGYLQAMPDEALLTVHLHELLSYLGQQDVVTILVMAQHGMLGSQLAVPVDTTYLADAVLMLRYFEERGEVRRAISMMKKRTGAHEVTIRELRLGAGGVSVGDPLRDLQGVLSGVPMLVGDRPA
ncbi:MAG TPA: ATPase domain-containing protein, partial [Gemmatimonadales bacterium]|nr:ATPase domain-containing protein [Gemmatimonadales bacterium]